MTKPTFTVIKLYFKSGLHLSQGKADNYDRTQLTLHSDTLKSALFTAGMDLFPEVFLGSEEKSKSFFEEFRISSAFPFYDAPTKTCYFLPKPLGHLPIRVSNVSVEKQGKMTRKIQYLEKDSLLEALNTPQGEWMAVAPTELTAKKQLLARGIDLHSRKLVTTSVQQQVSVSRSGQEDSLPFGIDKIYFGEGAGLYFLVDSSTSFLKTYLEPAIKWLGDSGLGTDRTTGGGHFVPEVVEEPFLWTPPSSTNRQINLSLFWPTKDDTAQLDTDQGLSFQLIRRGGYIAKPQNNDHLSIRKRSVYFIKEGAVFPAAATLSGQVNDLRPDPKPLRAAEVPIVDHPVWRDGQAIFLPI